MVLLDFVIWNKNLVKMIIMGRFLIEDLGIVGFRIVIC